MLRSNRYILGTLQRPCRRHIVLHVGIYTQGRTAKFMPESTNSELDSSLHACSSSASIYGAAWSVSAWYAIITSIAPIPGNFVDWLLAV